MCSAPKSRGSVQVKPVACTPSLSIAQIQKMTLISEQAELRPRVPKEARSPTRLCAQQRQLQAQKRASGSWWRWFLDHLRAMLTSSPDPKNGSIRS